MNPLKRIKKQDLKPSYPKIREEIATVFRGQIGMYNEFNPDFDNDNN